jgi:hypothetical protein
MSPGVKGFLLGAVVVVAYYHFRNPATGAKSSSA